MQRRPLTLRDLFVAIAIIAVGLALMRFSLTNDPSGRFSRREELQGSAFFLSWAVVGVGISRIFRWPIIATGVGSALQYAGVAAVLVVLSFTFILRREPHSTPRNAAVRAPAGPAAPAASQSALP